MWATKSVHGLCRYLLRGHPEGKTTPYHPLVIDRTVYRRPRHVSLTTPHDLHDIDRATTNLFRQITYAVTALDVTGSLLKTSVSCRSGLRDPDQVTRTTRRRSPGRTRLAHLFSSSTPSSVVSGCPTATENETQVFGPPTTRLPPFTDCTP